VVPAFTIVPFLLYPLCRAVLRPEWDEQSRVRENHHVHERGSDCAATCGYCVTAFARILTFQFG
jgi:hypothetical protein